MTDAVTSLTAVAEAIKAEDEIKPLPEPHWSLSELLRLMRASKTNGPADEVLVTLMCKMLDIPSFEEAGRSAVRAQVLG